MRVKIKKITQNAILPSYATDGSVGMDLYACINEPIQLDPLYRIVNNNSKQHIAIIPTGIAIELPVGYEAQIRPRSGLAAKHGITVLNTPGTIDSDYRGEIKVILINLGHETFTIEHGMRIAQMIVTPITRIEWEETDELGETKRGSGGFGSTGIRGDKNE